MLNLVGIHVGHKTLRLRNLAPKLSQAFSPNLYRWMRSSAHFYSDGGVAEAVYRIKPGSPAAQYLGAGTLLIGYPMDAYPGDRDFSGARLIGVLCNGTGERRACFSNLAPDIELVDGFWDRYLEVGRCAIDPTHHEHFIDNDRYREEGAQRICLWCGAKHQKVERHETLVLESWVPV